MRIGHSIILSEVVQADTVEYGDCAKYQIVCPCCREAIFKGVRSKDGHSTHYLSHYKADSTEAKECEMRVAELARKWGITTNAESHGQTLDYFLKVLRDRIIQAQEDAGVVGSNVMRQDVYRVLSRPYFDRYAALAKKIIDHEFVSSDLRKTYPDYLSAMPAFANRSPFWLRRQASYVLDVQDHLRTSQAAESLRFVAACAYVVFHRSPVPYRTRDKPIEPAVLNLLSAVGQGKPSDVVVKMENSAIAVLPRPAYERGYAAGGVADKDIFPDLPAAMTRKALLAGTNLPGPGLPGHTLEQRIFATAQLEIARSEVQKSENRLKELGKDMLDLKLMLALHGPFMGVIASVPFAEIRMMR